MASREPSRVILPPDPLPYENPHTGTTSPDEREPRHWQKSNVDMIYLNIHASSDFTIFRTGTNGSVHDAIVQVTKHIQRGLYKVVSLNASEHSCVVVISTTKKSEELKWKNGFPWDTPDDPQPDIVL